MNTNAKIVTFINPPGPRRLYRGMVCTYISKANYIWQPRDFINLSAQVPKDYDLRFIDCTINRIGESRLFDEIRRINPTLSIMALSSITFVQDLDFLRKFREDFPDMRCLTFGDVLMEEVFWQKILEYADGLLLNSMDVDLANYIKHGETKSTNLVLKKSQLQKESRLDSKGGPQKVYIGIPRHEIFINKNYRFPFAKSRLYSTVSSQFGCPFYCTYCPESRFSVAYRDYNEVLAEIEHVERIGTRDIFFGDASFGFPEENARKILEGMIGRNLSVRWCCYVNPELLDAEFLTLMKKANCHTVIVGVDDVDMEMLKHRYKREVSRKKLMEICLRCRDLNIQVCGDFIIGLNEINDNGAGIERVVNFAEELKLDYASFNIFTILPGSSLRAELVGVGKFDAYTVGYDTSGTFGGGKEELIRLRNLALKKFYLRPNYLFGRLMKIESLTEFVIQLGEMIAMFKKIMVGGKFT